MIDREDIQQEQTIAVWLGRPTDRLQALRLARRTERRLMARARTYDRYVGLVVDTVTPDGEELPFDEYLPSNDPTPEQALERKQAIGELLARLTPLQAQVALALADGWKQYEIADQLGVSCATVCHAVQQMRLALA